jgi:hypothetical protein
VRPPELSEKYLAEISFSRVLDTMDFCRAMLVASLRIACGRPKKSLKDGIPLWREIETHSLIRANHFFRFGVIAVGWSAGM